MKKFISFTIGMLMPLGVIAPAAAQNEPDDDTIAMEEVVVTGMRSSLETAQEIKRSSDAIVDSIVAEDIGKLPDRSIAETLQRVPGVTVSRFDNPGDPEHFAGEGAGVSIRGLPQVRAELNGRDIFSATGGRGLSFEDVPAELMAGVDVYKTPTADRIEGGLGGIVNLRTRMPFDSDGQVTSFTVEANYGDIIEETNTELSGLYSNRWDTGIGELGFLINLSTSTTSSRSDNILVRAFHPRSAEFGNEIEPGETLWIPRGADWRRNDFESQRDGQYLALQLAPSDDLQFDFTAFRSEADRDWDEHAFFIDAGGSFASFLPVEGAADDWVLDENNALVSGTITTAQGNGVPFGTSTRVSDNNAVTEDISLGFEWQATDRLLVSGDVQRVNSTAKTQDLTLGLVAFPPSITVRNLDTQDGTPSISVPDGFLSDFTNFAYGQMMSIPSDNEAESTAVRFDAEYAFSGSLFESIKTGVRFSEKSATNREGFSWSANYQPWMVGTTWQPFASTAEIPKIQDDTYVSLFSFDNFQRGDTNVPRSGYLIDARFLDDFESITSELIARSPGGCCTPDFDALDLTNPDNINRQDEETSAIYVRTDFGFEEWDVPVSGNLGVRYVETENVASGQLTFPTFEVDGVQPFFQPDESIDSENSYSNTLPSLNLRWEPTEQLVFRFSAAKAIWRPEFWRMKALLNLSAEFRDDVTQPDSIDDFDPSMVQFTLDSGGTNPFLEPMEAEQYDVTAEWYVDESSFMYLGLFTKDVEDFFRTSTTTLENVEGFENVTSTLDINTGSANVDGFEIGGTWFFDDIPALENFGVTANYTYVDSETEVPFDEGVEPVDTDGSTDFGTLPLEGLSEDTYNIALMYENPAFWARLAYNWRSEQLLSIGPNGFNGNNNGIAWRLPVFADEYGQLDLTFGYNFTDDLSVNFEAYNISQSETRGIFQQTSAGDRTAFVNAQDTRYAVSLRATFE